MEEAIIAAIHEVIDDDGKEAITRIIDTVLRAGADVFSSEEILSLLVSAAIGHVAADPGDAPAPETIAGALLAGMMTGMPEEFVSGKIAVKTRICGRIAIAVASRRTMPENLDALRIGLLHHAARIGDAAAIEALAGAGADPNAMDGKGRTPLHYAAMAHARRPLPRLPRPAPIRMPETSTEKLHSTTLRSARIRKSCRRLSRQAPMREPGTPTVTRPCVAPTRQGAVELSRLFSKQAVRLTKTVARVACHVPVDSWHAPFLRLHWTQSRNAGRCGASPASRLLRDNPHASIVPSGIAARVQRNAIRMDHCKPEPRWPPLWITGSPPPDSRRSLRRAGYPQLPTKRELLHHAVGHDPEVSDR